MDIDGLMGTLSKYEVYWNCGTDAPALIPGQEHRSFRQYLVVALKRWGCLRHRRPLVFKQLPKPGLISLPRVLACLVEGNAHRC